MSRSTLDQVIAFLRRGMREQGKEELDLLLFGGEPLVRPDLCEKVLRRTGEIGPVRASMVTNATLLTPRLAARLVAAGLREVQVSLDGDRVSHDALRATRTGQPTFDLVRRNLCSTDGLSWGLRINATGENWQSLEKLILQLSRQLDARKTHVHIGLIEDTGVGFGSVLPWDEPTARMLCSLYDAAHSVGFDVAPPPGGRCVYCEGHSERRGAVINADGALYSCWDAVGRSDLAVGHVASGYRDDATVEPRWRTCGYRSVEVDSAARTALWDYVNEHRLGLMVDRQMQTQGDRHANSYDVETAAAT